MYDPLGSSAAAFGGVDDTPAWPTTPHTPGTPIPYLPHSSPVPPTPEKGPVAGIYGKEPQIYGQPEPGLVSPRETLGSNGVPYEKLEPYLRVRINGLDRNRRDTLVKLDAQTNVPNFNGTTYRNISRSYFEFQQFYESIVQNNPQTIVPALPLSQTSAPTDDEDDRLVKIMLQRWITRVCEDPILLPDDDLRSFIESDFGYQPTPKQKRKSSTGFSLMRRGVPDEDEELQRARFELTKLEGQFFETAKAVDRLAVARKALSNTHAEMGNKLVNVASTEAHPPLANALRKLGRTWHSIADLEQAQATSESVIIGDSFGYQGLNARSAKETLQMRTGVLEEYQAAVKTTISKRRQIERLKASSNIRSERVDDALKEMEEADRYEQTLAKRAEGISQNLHRALQTYNRHANDDIKTALIENARTSILYERQLLRELEALRGDIDDAAKKVAPPVNGVPKPTIIPPLEDFSERPPFFEPVHSAPLSNGFDKPILPDAKPPHTAGFEKSPGFVPQKTSNVPANSLYHQTPITVSQPQTFIQPPPKTQRPLVIPPQSSVPRPSSPYDAPPLGGRFVDGTKSMFISRPTSNSQPSPLSGSASVPSIPSDGGPTDPLRNDKYPVVSSPLRDPLGRGPPQAVDPLASIKPRQMASSMRVQPTRPRVDAREAASKLANMF